MMITTTAKTTKLILTIIMNISNDDNDDDNNTDYNDNDDGACTNDKVCWGHRFVLNATLPRIFQRRILRMLPLELGRYLLDAGRGFSTHGEIGARD